MKIAILGRQPSIGIAELESLFDGENVRYINRESCLIATEKINISHFGSILKVGDIQAEINSIDWHTISQKIIEIITQKSKDIEGKITLGISTYGLKISPKDLQKTLEKTKQTLKSRGKSARIIEAKNLTLSTAISHNNKLGLNPKKIEIIVTAQKNRTFIAVSEGAQNITAYARRDQNRPKRDAFVGMLPPKLAQTMINLGAGENQPQINFLLNKTNRKTIEILDPFCGTGTVLQESMIKGFKAHGTDLSQKMIDYSKENIEWLIRDFRPFGQLGELFTADATVQKWEFAKNLQTVVCETYLGQPFSAPPSPKKLTEVRDNCNRIISNFLKNLGSQIKPGTQICVAVPAWKTQNGDFCHLPLLDFLNELGYTRKEFMRVKPQDLIYYREDQVVARELLVLIKE